MKCAYSLFVKNHRGCRQRGQEEEWHQQSRALLPLWSSSLFLAHKPLYSWPTNQINEQDSCQGYVPDAGLEGQGQNGASKAFLPTAKQTTLSPEQRQITSPIPHSIKYMPSNRTPDEWTIFWMQTKGAKRKRGASKAFLPTAKQSTLSPEQRQITSFFGQGRQTATPAKNPAENPAENPGRTRDRSPASGKTPPSGTPPGGTHPSEPIDVDALSDGSQGDRESHPGAGDQR